MSKIKFSFSLFFAIFLVGILSTATFAHSAYDLSAKADGTGGLIFSFDKNLQPSDTNTNFHLDVYSVDPTTQALSATPVFTNDFVYDNNNAASHSVDVKTGITVGTLYDFVLTNTTAGSPTQGQVVGEKFGVLTNGHNYRLAYTTNPGGTITYNNPDGVTVTLDIKGSGLANSNHTGADSAKKPGQGTHGFYQNNTNSCAVCHQTHTSDDASGFLLMKNGAYSTCTACHDGTTGGYNAFEEATTDTTNSVAGTFNVHMDGPSGTYNGSIHDADGSLKVSAAPGGNPNPGSKTPFSSSFDCASCHNPHGGGSSNENNLNQDPLGWGSVPYAATPGTQINWHGSTVTTTTDNEYGKLFVNPTIYTPSTIPGTKVASYIFVLNTAGVDLSTLTTTSTEYFYLNRDGYTSNTPILQTYRWQKGGYVPDFSLWLQEKGYPFKADTALYNDVWSNLTLSSADNYCDGSKDITRASGVTVIWKDGFAYGAGVANVQSIQVSLGVDVETTQYIQSLYQTNFSKQATDSKGNLLWLDDAKTQPKMVTYIPDSGVEFSKYCASCHTDYLSATRNDNTGVYTQAHRHMTLADETNCIRCHYAHGSDATIMHDSNDNTQLTANGVQPNGSNQTHFGDLNYYKDVNPSSALKRYTGMSVCFACHGQGEQFLGNPNNEHPVFGQPGTDDRSATVVPENQVPTP